MTHIRMIFFANQRTNQHAIFIRSLIIMLFCAGAFSFGSGNSLYARPVIKTHKGGTESPTVFAFQRQTNTYSNMLFYVTNKGVIFNAGNGNAEGLFWPRGSSNDYIFGGGLWLGIKEEISGRLTKLAEIGYNPNSGAGWYGGGEYGDEDNGSNVDQKYITYFSPRYDQYKGSYVGLPSSFVPDASINWPIWDTAATKTLKQNFYFGDYISKAANRNTTYLSTQIKNKTPKPAMFSQEDIVDIYDDADISQNPEYKPYTGYPFGINIVESIYSWSFGRYRDLVFVRYKLTNKSNLTFQQCYLAPAFDPDLATPQNNYDSYLSDADSTITKTDLNIPMPYREHPSLLNMGWVWSAPVSGAQYGVLGFSFLESPTIDAGGNLVNNSDSVALGGYGPTALKQLGLRTFQKWTLANDPSTQDLRYDFMAANTLNTDKTTEGDMRLLMATGPFNLKPNQTVTTTVGIGIALASTTTFNTNEDSLVALMAFAQTVFNNPVVTTVQVVDTINGKPVTVTDTTAEYVTHFLSPVPPDIPNMHTQALDRAVLVTWDTTSEFSLDPISSPLDAQGKPTKSLPFVGYQLYRTTRSDHDSTITPTGVNPNVLLGTWQLYNFTQDTIFNAKGILTGYRYVRKNTVPNVIPHSYLDVGDDNHNGVIDAGEGLINGATYYYYLVAFDEYDSVNKVGPLYTAIVAPKNFVSEVPAKPAFVAIPDSAQLSGPLGCEAGAVTNAKGITGINLNILDSGKFQALFTDDTIYVRFQPRWSELINQYLVQSPLDLYADLTDKTQGINITYDANYNPNASPPITPYNFATGIVQHVPGGTDSTFVGTFDFNQVLFQPYQLVDQAFGLSVNYQFRQLAARYRVHSIQLTSQANASMVRLSHRTVPGLTDTTKLDMNNLDSVTGPSFLGCLGNDTYEIDFGNAQPFVETDLDTASKTLRTIDSVYDKSSKSVFFPTVLPITVKRTTPGLCGNLHVIRPGNPNDYVPEFNCKFYSVTGCNDTLNETPGFNDPDSMLVPIPGWFAVDAFHYTDVNATNHSSAVYFTGPLSHTIGNSYFPISEGANFDGSTNKYLLTVHRIRIAGAEIILNGPGISSAESGDVAASQASQYSTDFAPGDKITVQFSGGCQGMPMPDTAFQIIPSGSGVNLANASLYATQAALAQVQVVPNPYIVTHIGQSSTDYGVLYFTRLPPRCTIQIYTAAGILVRTIEHNGYSYTSTATSSAGVYDTTYSYNTKTGGTLGDAAARETWNLLTDGGQRVGSQVLIARVIARDPNTLAELGEITTKFAVILGGYHITSN